MVDAGRVVLVHKPSGRILDGLTTPTVSPFGVFGDVTGVVNGDSVELHADYEPVYFPGIDRLGMPNPESERLGAGPSKRKAATAAQRREYREKVAEHQAQDELTRPDGDLVLMARALATVAGVDMQAVRAEFIRLKKAAAS